MLTIDRKMTRSDVASHSHMLTKTHTIHTDRSIVTVKSDDATLRIVTRSADVSNPAVL